MYYSPNTGYPNHRLVKVLVARNGVRGEEHGLACALVFGLGDRATVPIDDGFFGTSLRGRGEGPPGGPCETGTRHDGCGRLVHRVLLESTRVELGLDRGRPSRWHDSDGARGPRVFACGHSRFRRIGRRAA